MTESKPQNRRLGYARVSTYGQTLEAQLEQLWQRAGELFALVVARSLEHWPVPMSDERVSVAELINGMGDCLLAFGQLLANKGLLDRAELAAAFATAEKQASAQQQEMGGDIASRTYMARMLALLFERPLVGDRSEIRVVAVDGTSVEC
jgi:hypothetical protein